MKVPIIAVDFDGCLAADAWPEIGEPNIKAIFELQKRKVHGARVILWTCREGKDLEEALTWCKEHGLEFDAVNDNVPEAIEEMGYNSRKILAHEYWDNNGVVVKV